MAVGLTALQFMMSNGDLWEAIGGQAIAPAREPMSLGLPVNATTGAQTAITAAAYYQSMVASADVARPHSSDGRNEA